MKKKNCSEQHGGHRPVLIVHGTDDEVVSYQVRVFVTLFLPCVNPELALSQHGVELHEARTRLQLPQVAFMLLCCPSPAHIVYRNCFCRQAFIDPSILTRLQWPMCTIQHAGHNDLWSVRATVPMLEEHILCRRVFSLLLPSYVLCSFKKRCTKP